MGVILRAHTVRCESHIHRNANREVTTLLYLQKLYHKFFNLSFIKQLLFIRKYIGFLPVICRIYGL